MKNGIGKWFLATVVSTSAAVVGVVVLSEPVVRADGLSYDDVEIDIPTSCTISVDVSASSNHKTDLNSGQAKQGIGLTRMGAYCNDRNGYYIYAVGDSNGAGANGNTVLASDISSNYDIATGTALSGDTSNWALQISGGSGASAPTVVNKYLGKYVAVPASYEVVAYRESNTDMSVSNLDISGAYIDTTYQAYVTGAQPAGSYTGRVKYTLIHPFDSTKLISIDDAFRIAGSTKVAVDGQEYYKMQDMTKAICNMVSEVGEPSKAQLVDARDNKLYWVAKLGDENHSDCWMTQNLDLDITAGSTVLTSENTDLSSDQSVYTANNTIYALKGSGDTYGYTYENSIATWIPERSTIAYDQLNGTTWPDSNVYPYSYDRLDTTAGANNGQPVKPDSNVTDSHGLSGNYYNWTASIASNDSNNASSANPDQTNSICPKGWRLPSATNKEFGNLLVQYGIISTNTSTSYIENQSSVDSMGAAPLYLVRGGYVNGGSLGSSGSNGYYWSSTFGSTSYAYRLNFNSSNVYPQYGSDRRYGFSVRCVARSQ